ncbi:MAG: hypothetical protein Q8736_02630 [Sweet potato little leaf phytoplasma]|nr:hypothetical protein [Sweet potato little leaf phytoplasma]
MAEVCSSMCALEGGRGGSVTGQFSLLAWLNDDEVNGGFHLALHWHGVRSLTFINLPLSLSTGFPLFFSLFVLFSNMEKKKL